MAVIIESALLYVGILFTGVILDRIVWDPDSVGIAPFDFGVVLVLGLAPTMVIARVAYGKSVDSVQQELSTFCIAEVQASHQRSIATRQATIDLHTQSQHIIGDLQAGVDLQAIEESDAHKVV
ncbi:hypothetical protein L218DRAFT_1005959 [Marasmius fiardii PR-910]|nr:hypothetical protein L218DRAFT_1005959 [Marasmius fiardii PR-910]